MFALENNVHAWVVVTTASLLFTSSPFAPLTFDARYRHRANELEQNPNERVMLNMYMVLSIYSSMALNPSDVDISCATCERIERKCFMSFLTAQSARKVQKIRICMHIVTGTYARGDFPLIFLQTVCMYVSYESGFCFPLHFV